MVSEAENIVMVLHHWVDVWVFMMCGNRLTVCCHPVTAATLCRSQTGILTDLKGLFCCGN